MMGSFLTRALILVFGYAYPAYKCYKTVELNKAEIEQLRFWCQYWILVALLSVLEIFGDIFFSWLPMYCEVKLALYIYLWYPKIRGTTYIYGTFFKPYIAKHESEIDRNLLELKARAADIMLMYCQKAAGYGRTSFFDMLNYVTLMLQAPRTRSQKTQQPAMSEQPQPETRVPQVSQSPSPAPPAHQPATSQQPQQETRVPSSPVKKLQEQPRKTSFHVRAASPLQPPSPAETRVPSSPINKQPQEQSRKAGVHLRAGSPAQTQEPGPDTHNLETANLPYDPEDSNPTSDESHESASGEEIRAARSNLKKRTATAAVTTRVP